VKDESLIRKRLAALEEVQQLGAEIAELEAIIARKKLDNYRQKSPFSDDEEDLDYRRARAWYDRNYPSPGPQPQPQPSRQRPPSSGDKKVDYWRWEDDDLGGYKTWRQDQEDRRKGRDI
jgi:hypothetical protein